ncbi:hypothetical protein U1Q18_023998 [Sarracenia purpurea var. burkii]
MARKLRSGSSKLRSGYHSAARRRQPSRLPPLAATPSRDTAHRRLPVGVVTGGLRLDQSTTAHRQHQTPAQPPRAPPTPVIPPLQRLRNIPLRPCCAARLQYTPPLRHIASPSSELPSNPIKPISPPAH